MPNFEVFSDFESASHAVLTFLHQRLGFGLWMVTRTEGENWIVLQAEDHGYGVKPGDVFCWSDSFCSQMIQGNGPRIAPICQLEPAYANAPIGQQVRIGAYVGVPLTYKDGSLFGTLCAIDPNPQSENLVTELFLVELLAQLLSSVLRPQKSERYPWSWCWRSPNHSSGAGYVSGSEETGHCCQDWRR